MFVVILWNGLHGRNVEGLAAYVERNEKAIQAWECLGTEQSIMKAIETRKMLIHLRHFRLSYWEVCQESCSPQEQKLQTNFVCLYWNHFFYSPNVGCFLIQPGKVRQECFEQFVQSFTSTRNVPTESKKKFLKVTGLIFELLLKLTKQILAQFRLGVVGQKCLSVDS